MKTYKPLFLVLFLLSCSSVGIKEALNKPKDIFFKTEKKPENLITTNRWTFNASLEEVWDATLKSLQWIKWKPFLLDYKNNKIFLKEAYIYEDNDSIKRIYTWPPVEKLKESNLSKYIETIAHADRHIKKQTVFTQENMRIKIKKEENEKKTTVEINYEIIPHLKTEEIGPPLKSKKYIEGILIQKIKEHLFAKENI